MLYTHTTLLYSISTLLLCVIFVLSLVYDLYKLKSFFKYLVIWISQNLSIPFWMVGHIHLSVNMYEDVYEVLASVGMNLVVATGFFLDYFDQRK